MDNLQITAWLSAPLAVMDDWTPQLEGLLMYYWLDRLGLNYPNPTAEQVAQVSHSLVNFPIKKHDKDGFYFCSAPIYSYVVDQQSRYRKRWTPDQDGTINWGKRRAKFSTSEGAEKSYDLPLFLRLTHRIDWYCVGEAEAIQQLLIPVKGIGKKRSQGFGQIAKWDVVKIDNDWSVVKDSVLMKPLPGYILEYLRIKKNYNMMQWGWKPPAWLIENQSLCYMPNNVTRC